MKENIILLFGGNSVEHEISIITALQLKKKYKGKYNLLLCYLKEGEFYFSKKLCDINTYKRKTKLKKALFKANQNVLFVGYKKIHFSAVLIITHGANCEDGTLYSYFKTLNINVISQSPYSAIIGQDKILTKKLCDVPVIPFFEINNDILSNNLDDIIKNCYNLQFPLILKPTNLGSSVGIKVAYDSDDLMDGVDELLHLSNSIVVEKKLTNFIELNIAIFKYKNDFVLSEIEKVSTNKTLSYDDKYFNNSKSMENQSKELPAYIDETLKKTIEEYAVIAYKNLRCTYIVRFDFLYDTNKQKLYLNEVNNIPGSLALYLFEAKNLNTNDIIDKYIDEGLKECDEENALVTSYNKNILKEQDFNFFKYEK